jgi:ribose transport system substrate-binding protein
MAELALQACKAAGESPCTIARIGGLPQFATEQLLTKGSQDTIAAAGSAAKLVSTVYAGGYTANDGLKAAQDLLTAHPDLDVILGPDPLLKGIEQAVGKSGKHVQLVGLAGTKYGMTAVADGRYFGEVVFFPKYLGEQAGKTILKHVADPSLKGEAPPAARPDVPLVYTKANIDRFAGEYD